MRITKYLILIFILTLVIYGTFFFYSLSVPNSASGQIVTFTIQPRSGSVAISRELEEKGLVRHWTVFELYVWFKGSSSLLQPGEYELPKNLTVRELAQILSRGPESAVLKETTLTFIEGWNNSDYADYLAKQGFGKQADFFEIVQKKQAWWDDYGFLASRPKDRDLEGYLFPDTYRVYKNATIAEIVKKMLGNLEVKLTPEIRQAAEKKGLSIHELITLASIIEKEVSTDTDRKLVADIFYKRLENKIGLQSDATLNYITGKGTIRPSVEDTRLDSPYNTYKYRGLPPGPICNPGISAIKAPAYPTKNDYWYFLTTPEGKVIYSKTYDEHLAAKRKYLK